MISYQSIIYYALATLAFFILNPITDEALRKKVFFIINLLFLSALLFYRKKHFGLLIGFTGVNYFILRASLGKTWGAWVRGAQIVLSVSILMFFKYELIYVPLINLMPTLGWWLRPAVFIGISFFSFRLISAVVDIGSEKTAPDFFHFANFLTFFPCFLSGPLDRFYRFSEDFEEFTPLKADDTYKALWRIIFGAFKKGILADMLWSFSTISYHQSEIFSLPMSTIFIAHYVYALVLYLDFSGYSDMAIGVSALYGVRTPENFNNPYFSRNIQEFWNRWHISFMHWLRDYLFYPFQSLLINFGATNFIAVACTSYLLTFFIAGIWHGDTTDFALYGLSHGLAFSVYLIFKRMLEVHLKAETLERYKASMSVRIFATALTFHYFYFSLFLFTGKAEIFVRIKRIIWG